jgi:Fe-S-cluster containining protein
MKTNRSSETSPWYADGLNFTCVEDCGGCCTDHGEYAFVYLDLPTERKIARHLELDLATFRERYTALDEGNRVLRMDTPDCPFLSGKRCTIYPARPAQCSTFPFWEENLSSPRAWKKLAKFCPGIDTGEHHSLRLIRETIDED